MTDDQSPPQPPNTGQPPEPEPMTRERAIELLRTDVKAWNKWREGKKKEELPDLHHADLSGANLRAADLWGADLRGSDLSGSDLSGADLSGADLDSQKLRDSNLRYANVTDPDPP